MDTIDVYQRYLDECADTGCGYRQAAEARIAALQTTSERWGQPPITPNEGAQPGRFVKIDDRGRALPDDATLWSCVRDTGTGLIWEVKTADGGLRDKDHSYTWYNEDPEAHGGNPGAKDGGACAGGARCDTSGFAAAVNAAGLCGWNDWRLPTREELRSIVDYGAHNPAIEQRWFPNTRAVGFWSASVPAASPAYAWYLPFYYGYDYWDKRERALQVRLVRAGQ